MDVTNVINSKKSDLNILFLHIVVFYLAYGSKNNYSIYS